MLVKVGSFFLVPFLVLVATDQPGLVGLLHEGHSRPLAERQHYLPIALKCRSQVVRTIETPPQAPSVPWALPCILAEPARVAAQERGSLVIADAAALHALLSLQI